MESPEGCLTNVLKIDGLSHIPYHVFIATTRRLNPAHKASSTSQTIPNISALRRGEKYLREKGILGISELSNGELWVFDINIGVAAGQDAAASDDTAMTGVGIDIHHRSQRGWRVEFPPHWDLRESREGIFQASYLASAGKSTNEEALGSLSNAIDLTGGDKVLSPESTSPDLPHVVYKHLIASVLSAVSYGISKSSLEDEDKRWVPLNITTLIQIQYKYTPISTSPTVSSFSLPTPPSSARMNNNGKTESHGRGGVMMFSVSGYLTSSGTLCIIPTGRRVEGLGGLASLLNTSDATHLVSHVVGRDVWIAPWGRVGRIQGLVSSAPDAPTAMRADERKWAGEVRHYLLERGVGLRTDEEEWARVEVWLDNEDGEDRLQIIVWPIALCFIRLSEGDHGLLSNPSQGTSVQFESLGPKQPGQESSGEGNAKDGRMTESTAFSQDLFADFEYLALGGQVSILQGEKPAPDDPGAIWFSPSVLDPIGFAEKWRMSAEQRKQTMKQRREEREKEKRNAMEAEALKRKAEELLGKEKELRRGVDEIKRDAAATIGSVSGVYSTPPDGQVPATTALTGGSQETPLPEPTSAISTDSTLPLTLSNGMDLDWTGAGDPMSLDEGGDGTKTSATDGLAGIADFLGDDLVDGDDDIFGAEVTDKDFDFFDEPDFGDTLDGGIGLGDMHHVGGGAGTDTLRDVEGSSLAVADMIDMSSHSNPMNSLQNLDFGGMDRIDGTTGLEINITTPMLSKLELPSSAPGDPREGATPRVGPRAEVIKHLQTPPLSPQRAMKLLLPQYAKNQTTWNLPQFSPSPFDPPRAHLAVDDLTNPRRQSIYSPLIFLPGVEMADKKYMEGGRFFCPPPKEERLELLDGKLASISLLDTPLKRKLSNRKPLGSLISNTPRDSIHHSQAAEPAIEDLETRPPDGEDVDSDESGYEYDDDDESSESDVDEESETEYSLPPLPESSPIYTTGDKRKRAVDDDGDLALTETGQESASVATPGRFDIGGKNGGVELAPPPWHTMVPDPDDYCLVDVFEKLCADDTTRDEYSTVSKMGDAEYGFVYHALVGTIVTGSLLQPRYSGVDSSVFREDNNLDSLMTRRRVSGESQVEEVVKGVFPGATRCKFEAYATIPDAPTDSTPTPGKASFRPIAQPRRTGKQPALTPGNSSLAFDSSTRSSTVAFKIPPSHVHVHRAEAALEISPVALKFWETFGLGPCSGPKNVIGFCVYPSGEAMADAVDEFMERVGTVYDSCKLGSYVRGNIDDITAGMVGVQLPPRHAGEFDMGAIMQCIKDTCTKLGYMLYNVADEMQNIVVYLVNPFLKASALPELCHAFYFLSQAYWTTMAHFNATTNNIILQIVPIDLLTAKNGLVTPSQEDYIRFSLEVYNRCTVTESGTSSKEVRNDKVSLFPSSSSSLSSSSKMSMAKNAPRASSMLISWRQKIRERGFIYAPSIVLAKPVPKSINFRLSAETVNPLLQEGSCLHMAYKQSLDERWVVFAWTDNYGDFQQNEAICLGRKGCVALKPWEEVARGAWSRTMGFIRGKNMMPRVCITKVGGWIDAHEVDLWTTLSTESAQPNTTNPQLGPLNQSQKTTTISLTILTADPSPTLSLAPSLPAIAPQAFNSSSTLFTPVSTPNANMLSPDPSGSASAINTNTAGGTPNADAALDLDPDTQLTDYADEVWGVVLNHKLPISPVVTEARYSLASGFLVKRGAKGVEGGEEPAVLGVNVVRMNGVGTGSASFAGKNVAEGQLKEVLCQWRGLATLAIHKGVVREREKRSVLPWHVAVAEKAVDALEMCM